MNYYHSENFKNTNRLFEHSDLKIALKRCSYLNNRAINIFRDCLPDLSPESQDYVGALCDNIALINSEEDRNKHGLTPAGAAELVIKVLKLIEKKQKSDIHIGSQELAKIANGINLYNF
jgi:hypothetical protein